MRLAILVLSLLAGCGTTATSSPATVRPAGTEDAAYACMLSALNRDGFTVTESDRPSLIRAESRLPSSAFSLAPTAFLVVTVSIFDDDGATIRVSPELQREGPTGGPRSAMSTVRDEDNKRAESLARSCVRGS